MSVNMRIVLVLALAMFATSVLVANGVDAADKAQAQVCTSADYADGTCHQDEGRSDDSSDDGYDGYGDSDDDGDDVEGGLEDGPASACADRDDKCAAYAREGACTDNPAYMIHHCPATCGTCDAVAAARGGYPCTDEDYRCLEWAGMGECDANPGYMRRGCRRSCLVCLAGSDQFGVEQNAVEENTYERLQQTIKYMQTVWSDQKFRRVRHKCNNQHADCTLWASLGECKENPTYMQTNCGPACQTCELLDIQRRCPIEPDNKSIWQPGDLNKLMETIVDDADGSGDYKQYNPKALSRPKHKQDGTLVEGVTRDGPWVVLLENFVKDTEADRLVELGMRQGYERSADVGKEKPDGTHDSLVSDSRTSHNTWCKEKACTEDPLVAPVVERVANVTKTGVTNSEYLQLLQYEPGQYYRQHHDYIPHHQDMPCGVRILTLFIYLNDVEEGGGTHFPLLDITVQPKKGSAVLWPSVLDQSPESKDGRTDHEALPVIKGIKYGANAWIHSRDFKAAYAINCH